MKRSTDRILTTHTGSLARPDDILEMIRARTAGQEYDPLAFERKTRLAVEEVVRKQVENGIDTVSDGELSKPQFADYVAERWNGMEGENPGFRFAGAPEDVPGYGAWWRGQASASAFFTGRRPMCVGPLSWKDRAAVELDIANLKAAAANTGAREAFMPSPSPGIISIRIPNQYYPSEEAYLYALADVLKEEYRAIVEAGFLLQVDAPDIAMGRHLFFYDLPDSDFRKAIQLRTEALNHALEGIPEESVRFHVCWGNNEGPHTRDVPLAEIIDIVLTTKAQAFSIEASNPRHAHEWELWQDVKLPGGKLLIPGVVDSLTNFVEHPRLIAQRVVNYAKLVGRENVMAGTDCGFGTFAGSPRVYPEVVWAKFRAMAEGCELASRELWN
jgi:5-methyltetrahydropteroyltriglutamate--homocysteine methyltransferase